MCAVRPVVADKERRCLAAHPWLGRVVCRPGRQLRVRLCRVVDDVHPFTRRVELIGRGANLRVAPEERVTGRAGIAEVAAITSSARAGLGARLIVEERIVSLGLRLRHRLGSRLILRVVLGERRHQHRRRERFAAVGRLRDHHRVRILAAVELAEGHIDVPVARDGDVRELDVVDRGRQLHRRRERDAVIGRAREVDPHAAVPGEARPREVDVPVTRAARPVGFDRRLVVELAEQVRCRRATCATTVVPR